MENLTHTLVGLMMARCGLEKTTVRGAGMMMLAANAPDVDGVFWFNRLHYLDYHRSYAHSFALRAFDGASADGAGAREVFVEILWSRHRRRP